MKKITKSTMGSTGRAFDYTATICWADSTKLTCNPQADDMQSSPDVIIQYNREASVHNRAAAVQAGLRRLAARDINLGRDLSVIKSRHFSMPASLLGELANDPEFAFSTSERPSHANLDLVAAGAANRVAHPV